MQIYASEAIFMHTINIFIFEIFLFLHIKICKSPSKYFHFSGITRVSGPKSRSDAGII